ncbi:septum site-determining protein MinD [Nanobdella aerobiophila]|uniref:Septum site-determining protein MinD n=1 Tax=Nanobdella aerobiophila TaxID=2586965 RepID=A0A915WT15_9ARCH|nr:AAA family ATPase [Nanobdella aerobiophila]BBL45880.1 septum site-determining protein MinD [Nanobdella aerobiophila]
MAKIITISSGKGGVGKTFFSINLSRALSKLDYRVLLVDLNLTTPNVSINLNLGHLENNLHKYLRNEIDDINKCIIKFKENFYILPGSLDINDISFISFERLHKITLELYNDYDFIIIDSAAGIGRESLEALKIGEELFIITNYEKSSLVDAYRVIKVANNLNTNIKGIIINKVKRKINYIKIERFLGKNIYGIIHYDDNVDKSIENGMTLIDYNINSIASIDIIKIAEKITGKDFEETKNILNVLKNIFRWR